MLKWFTLVLALFITSGAQAQRVQHPDTWLNELLRSSSPIQQIRVLRGTFSGGGIDSGFVGNPLVTISSINTSGGIVTSRDADLAGCKVPCAIQASSSAITAIGTSKPYMDLGCSFSFGDAAGTETFTRPTDGATVNANTDQTGCDAAYIYRTPGTYTITLTLKGSNGTCNSSGRCAVISNTVTKNVTVVAFSATGGEIWYDSNFVCAPTCLGTFADPYNNVSSWSAGTTLLNNGNNNVAINVKRGSTFSPTQGWEQFNGFCVSGIRIRAYGSGARPIIDTGGSTTRMNLGIGAGNNPASCVNDFVISDIRFTNSGYAGGLIGITNRRGGTAAGGSMDNIYFDNVDMEVTTIAGQAPFGVFGTTGGSNSSVLEEGNRFGCWKCLVKSPTATAAAGIGKLGSAATWDFFVGGSFEGSGTSRIFDHHYYPDTREHFMAQWVTFGLTGTGNDTRSFGINGNWDGELKKYNDHQIAQYYAINENYFMGSGIGGTDHTIDLGNRTNNTPNSDITASIAGTTLTVSAFNGGNPLSAGTGTGSFSSTSLINTFAGGTLINGTRIVGSSAVNSGLCSPSCTGSGGTGTYAVDTSQTVASQGMYGADSTVFFDNVVISGNGEKGFENTSMLWGDGRSVTIRDGRVWGGTLEWLRPAVDQFPSWTLYQNATNNIYRMKIYMGGSSAGCIVCFNSGKTWTTPQFVSYNIMVDARTTPSFQEFVWTDFVSNGSVWNFNTWSAPNGVNPFRDGAYNSTGKSFANWQAAAPPKWGVNDTNLGTACPSGWTCPPTTWAHMN